MKYILIVLISTAMCTENMFTVEDGILYDVQILNVTYLDGAVKRIDNHGMVERGVILKLHALLGEVQAGKHPNWRSREIVEIAKTYVDLNKTRKTLLVDLQSKMNNLDNKQLKET